MKTQETGSFTSGSGQKVDWFEVKIDGIKRGWAQINTVTGNVDAITIDEHHYDHALHVTSIEDAKQKIGYES